jgi:hypothetical protein
VNPLIDEADEISWMLHGMRRSVEEAEGGLAAQTERRSHC